MKKCVFIIPYFGKMNNYTELFLKSCSWNDDFDWLIFTDDRRCFNYPANVKVIYCGFSDIQQLINEKLGYYICHPYKLCDFRPAYGYIFSSYLSNYKMWGYCDNDLIFGRLNRWITDSVIDNYDKIGILGHLTMIKNTENHNRIFMDSLNGRFIYKDVFSSKENKFFDEQGGVSINTLFRQRNLKIFTDFPIADICTLHSSFRNVIYNSDSTYRVSPKEECLYVWQNGKLLRYSKQESDLICEEYAYIHLQKRNMKLQHQLLEAKLDQYMIIPNEFIELPEIPNNIVEFNKLHKENFNCQWIRIKYLHLKMKFNKLKNFMGEICR